MGERVARMIEGDFPLLAFKYHKSGRHDMGRPKQRWINEEALQDQVKQALFNVRFVMMMMMMMIIIIIIMTKLKYIRHYLQFRIMAKHSHALLYQRSL
jgi:hypothetical protein